MSSAEIMITSRNVTVSNCDREQVQYSGAILPHGALLTVSEPELRILQASVNCKEMLGSAVHELIGDSLSRLFDPGQLTVARDNLCSHKLAGSPRHLGRMSIAGRDLDVFAHRCEGVVIFEFERSPTGESRPVLEIYSDLRSAITELQATGSLQEFLNLTAEKIREFTGFDRVMVYKFMEDSSGVVRSESLIEGHDFTTYLGLHYPASDIPEPARRLFRLAWLRHQPDIDYTPVPIVPEINPATDGPLDLSYALLRSVSVMYTGYLRNMGTRASMVLTLAKDERLWGLIACHHHRGPKHVPYEIRVACEFLAQMVSALITAKEDLESYDYQTSLKSTEGLLLQNLANESDFGIALLRRAPTLLDFVRSTGAAVVVDGRVVSLGLTPSDEQIAALADWLSVKAPSPVFATDAISTQYSAAASYHDITSGVLALRFSTSAKDFALWFRPEQIQVVNWAGDPHKPVDISDDGQRLMPRTSFALWKETVRGKAEPWLGVEVDAVSDLRRAILGAEIELRALNAKLESLVEQRTASLREKEERLRLAQEAAHVASWEWDITGDRLLGSAEFNEFYALAPGESISYADWIERVVPEDRENVNAGLGRLRRGEVDCEAEFRVRHADGAIRWHLARGAGFGTADGRVERALGVSVDITDDKEAEANLRASEALLRTFVRYVPAAVAMLDRHLKYLQVSERWSQDFGLESEQVLGRTVYEVFPYLPEHWKKAHLHCLAGESAFGEETAIDSPDGRRIWVRWEIRPFGDRTGEPQGILVFTEDITQRRQMQRQLRMRTDALDNALTAFCLVASDGTITYANRTYVSLWGYEKLSEIVGTEVKQYLADPGVVASIADELVRHDHCTIEFAARRKDGSKFYALSTIQSSIDSDSNRSYICAALDITDRKRVETALRESEATNRTLLETASQGIVAVSENGSIVIANRKAAELFGYEQTELLGKSISSLLSDSSAGEKALAMLQSIGTELRVVHKNGFEFPIEISISHLDTKNGPLAVAFITDISKRKHDEAALRSSQEELRYLAGSLLTAQEDERRRIARDLHDDVTQELALISIDIGTLAKALPDDDASIPVLRALQSRIAEVSRVVRHLSHGLHPSMLEALGLTAALEASCEEFSQIEGIPVEFDPEADEEQLGEAEAACLYRIAQESLRNIAKHAHASQVKVELTSDRNHMHLLVHDNGVGMASSRPDVRGPVGLGLVAMKERIRLVNGTLSITSSPGEGTHIISSVPLEGTSHATTAHSSS